MQVTLGEKLNSPQKLDTRLMRDAIHIAVAAVVAGELLVPGEDIGFIGNDHETVGHIDQPIGIVDPFLSENLRLGDRFWMLLYQHSITSLRHTWSHPAF